MRAKKDERKLLVGLDIGTSKVVAVVGELSPEGTLEVIGIGSHPSRGLKRGVDRDPVQPGGEPGIAAKRRKCPDRSDPRFLSVVLSQLIITGDAPHHRVHPWGVPIVQGPDGSSVALACLFDQVCFDRD